MRLVMKPSTLLAGLVGFQLLLFAAPVLSQSSNQSGDASDLLKSLTNDQDGSILDKLAGQRGDTGQSDTDRQRLGPVGQGERLRPPKTLEQRRAELEQAQELNPLFPMLQGQDWVIVEADFFLPPRQLGLQTLQGLGAVSPQTLQAMQGSAALSALNAAGANTPSALLAQAAAGQSTLAPGAAAVPGAGYAPGAAGGGNGPVYTVSGRKLSEEDRKRLQDLIDLIRSRNPYRLGRDGSLTLPGFAPIALLGLNDDQATLRLKVEPALRDIDIRLTRLPLKKVGQEGLKPFGYDLFWNDRSTFAPAMNVPVPADYVVGPGDELQIQLFGNQNRNFTASVGRDGDVHLPSIGPVNVGGQLFNSAKARIEAQVEHLMIGVRASVSMRDTRSISVFVMGDVNTPGSYTISGLSTVTSALFAAGGIKPIGSMRRIELRRNGALVRTLDLYDLLLRGNSSGDSRLQSGDVVFIPPVGATVGVDGEVHRPAIYEVKDEESVAQLLALAGGVTADAARAAVLTRIDAAHRRVVLPVDLESADTRSLRVSNGDLLRIDRLRPTLDSAVLLQGHVFTSGAFSYHPGMRLTDVVNSVDQLQLGSDIHYLLIRRESQPDRHVSAVSADLAAALKAPGSAADVELQPRDRITVFDLTSTRERIMQPLIDELRAQSSASDPPSIVHVEGKVRVPGDYPLEPNMTVADLVRAAGGLAEEAYRGRAELARYRVVDGVARRTELQNIDLTGAAHDAAGNLVLAPYDNLSVKEVTSWSQQDTIKLSGEVRFPGDYPIREGETLKSVITRAGGLTAYAYPEGSVFTRVELRRREQEQIDLLVTRTQTDLTAAAMMPTVSTQTGAGAALAMGQSLLAQLKAAKPIGRLVVDLQRALREPPGSVADVVLRDGDELMVPKFQQQVTVIGEVQNATSHLYAPGISRDGYVAMSGGMTRMADARRIYIVRANGSVVVNEGSRWFQHGDNARIRPGDTIVVPLDTEHLPSLPFWQAVTGILYNVAVSVAAVHYL